MKPGPPGRKGAARRRAEETPASAAPPGGERVACVRCGANLQSQPAEGKCPACGHPVADSLRGEFLTFADPAISQRLAEAIQIALIGVTLLGVLLVMSVLGLFVSIRSTDAFLAAVDRTFSLLLTFGMVLPLVTLSGVALLAQRDPSRDELLARLTAPRLLRYALRGLPVGVALLAAYLYSRPLFSSLALLLWIVLPQALFLYVLERLMRRVPNVRLAVRTRNFRLWTLGFGAAALIVRSVELAGAQHDAQGVLLAFQILTLGAGLALGAESVRLLSAARSTFTLAAREAARNEQLVRDFAEKLGA